MEMQHRAFWRGSLENKMKIALIALEFPPLNTAGSVRPFRMAEFLGKQGMSVTVFTLSKDPEHRLFSKPNNLHLESDTFEQIDISPSHPKRNQRNKLREWLSVGDYYLDVWGSDVQAAMELHINTHGKPDWIIGTCPPFSTALLTRNLSRLFNIPYVLDLRDAWSQWNVNPLTSYFHYHTVLRRERKCIRDARLTLTTSNQTREDLLKLHGHSSTIITVENGFDVDIQFPDDISWNNEKLVIGYVGTFYYDPDSHKRMHTPWHKRAPHRWLHFTPRLEDWTYRSPLYFFRILEHLFTSDPIWKEKIRIEFVGRVPDWLESMIDEFDLRAVTTLHGQVSLEKSLELQKRFDFFLGTSAKIAGQPDYSMGSKYYEALQFLKPILAVCGPSPLADLVREGNIGIVLEPDLPEESALRLADFIASGKQELNPQQLAPRSRPHQLEKLMDFLINQS